MTAPKLAAITGRQYFGLALMSFMAGHASRQKPTTLETLRSFRTSRQQRHKSAINLNAEICFFHQSNPYAAVALITYSLYITHASFLRVAPR